MNEEGRNEPRPRRQPSVKNPSIGEIVVRGHNAPVSGALSDQYGAEQHGQSPCRGPGQGIGPGRRRGRSLHFMRQLEEDGLNQFDPDGLGNEVAPGRCRRYGHRRVPRCRQLRAGHAAAVRAARLGLDFAAGGRRAGFAQIKPISTCQCCRRPDLGNKQGENEQKTKHGSRIQNP